MEIKLAGYELEEAVLDFIKNKYGHSFELSEHDPCMMLETSERVWVYQKHKNGRIKKDPEDGYRLIDYDKSSWKRTFTTIGECDDISFYVKEIDKEQTSE